MSKANAFSALFREAGRQHGVAESEKPEAAAQPPGRKKGKREDPEFGKIGVYVRHSTVTEVKTRLLRQNLDLSDLVQTLLDSWLETGRDKR
jgi:hypothetical protein